MPTTGTLMDNAAALLNDANKDLYTYTAQLPYLKSAYAKLLMRLQDAGVPVLREISAVIDVAANATTVTLPSDLIQPISLAERSDGSSDLFQDVDEVSDIPELDPVDNIIYWSWREEAVTINPPRTARDVKLKYWKTLSAIADHTSTISVLNSQEYLQFRTAALCARYLGENNSRADYLDAEAETALTLAIGMEVKAMQNRPVRPSGYGSRARRHRNTLIIRN